jgi:peptidoglycan/LPS O-acetylase OafA/YrhL
MSVEKRSQHCVPKQQLGQLPKHGQIHRQIIARSTPNRLIRKNSFKGIDTVKYRPEIDGLRAFAVVPVILFHSGLTALSGGFVGVDVFFVISGYLITTILVNDLDAGRYSILTFYERRARRILPALSVMLLATIPFAWAWMTPDQLKDFGQAMAATALFGSNILFWMKTGYFENAAEMNALLHTWSLAVEEQFYIVFPPLLYLIWRLGRRALVPVLVLIAVASFAICLWLVREEPSANFYLAPSRAWELLAGSFCALTLLRRDGPLLGGAAGGLAAAAGLVLVLGGMAVIGEETPFPGMMTLLPVGGTVLLILFATPHNLAGRILTLRPVVWTGLISYSAYLFHPPLLAMARIRFGGEPPLVRMLGLGALSLPLAWLSWRYVERPFRGSSPQLLKTRNAVFAASGVVLAVWLGLGGMASVTEGWAGRFPQIARLMESSATPTTRLPCQFTRDYDPDKARACLEAGGDKTVILYGDSHAHAIRAAFHDAAKAQGLAPVIFFHFGCYPVAGTVRLPATTTENASCTRFVKRSTDLIGQSQAPVVLMTRWALNLEGTRFDNHEGGVESGSSVRVALPDAPAAAAPTEAILTHTAAQMRALARDRRLVLVGPFPEAGWNVPEVVAGRMRLGATDPVLSTSAGLFETRNANAHRLLQDLEGDETIRVGHPAEALCDSVAEGRCINYRDGTSYYRDDDHPSPAAADLITKLALEAALAP